MNGAQTPEDVAELVEKQKSILAGAARLVKPGGRLVYATCSILDEENRGIVGDFLRKCPIHAAKARAMCLKEAASGSRWRSISSFGRIGMAPTASLPRCSSVSPEAGHRLSCTIVPYIPVKISRRGTEFSVDLPVCKDMNEIRKTLTAAIGDSALALCMDSRRIVALQREFDGIQRPVFRHFRPPVWGYILAALGLTHITIVSVTVFLHRHQAAPRAGPASPGEPLLPPMAVDDDGHWYEGSGAAIHRKAPRKCENR